MLSNNTVGKLTRKANQENRIQYISECFPWILQLLVWCIQIHPEKIVKSNFSNFANICGTLSLTVSSNRPLFLTSWTSWPRLWVKICKIKFQQKRLNLPLILAFTFSKTVAETDDNVDRATRSMKTQGLIMMILLCKQNAKSSEIRG